MKSKLFSSVLILLPFLTPFEHLVQPEMKEEAGVLELYMYSPGSEYIIGETLNGHFTAEKAIELEALKLSTSNNVYFGTQAGVGLSTGKASGNSITFETKASTAIPQFYQFLCSGTHYPNIIIAIGQSGVNINPGPENFKYDEKIELKLVLLSNVEVEASSPSDGQTTYIITMHYGAIKRTLYEYDSNGTVSNEQSVEWSYILNNNTFDIQ